MIKDLPKNFSLWVSGSKVMAVLRCVKYRFISFKVISVTFTLKKFAKALIVVWVLQTNQSWVLWVGRIECWGADGCTFAYLSWVGPCWACPQSPWLPRAAVWPLLEPTGGHWSLSGRCHGRGHHGSPEGSLSSRGCGQTAHIPNTKFWNITE